MVLLTKDTNEPKLIPRKLKLQQWCVKGWVVHTRAASVKDLLLTIHLGRGVSLGTIEPHT